MINWGGKQWRPGNPNRRQPVNQSVSDLMKPLGEKAYRGNVWMPIIMNVPQETSVPDVSPTPTNTQTPTNTGTPTPTPTPTLFNQMYVAGAFTTFNGNTRNRIVSLEESGVEVTSFYTNVGSGFSATPQELIIQPDGKILVGGSFTTFNANTRNRIVRLNNDGTEDTAFYTNLGGTAFSSTINQIGLQSDNKIIAFGQFSGVNSISYGRIAKLNSDGSLNTTFLSNIGTAFNSSTNGSIQSDDKIVVGGSFTGFNGNVRSGMVRLNSDGTEDTAFYTNLGTGFSSSTNGLEIQSDGKIVVVGTFTGFNGNTRIRIVRLNSDGTEDTAFYTNIGTGFSASPNGVIIQPDGKIIVYGGFTTFNGNTRNRMVRLNSDGTEDTAFYTNLGTAFGSSISINPVALQPDGKILVGGAYTLFNGLTRNRIVRLNSDGTEDTSFYTNLGTAFNSIVNAIAYKQNLPNPSPTPTPTNTETPTNTPTPTNTETPTNTPTPTNTETPTNTPTPTNTETPTPTPSATPSIPTSNLQQWYISTDSVSVSSWTNLGLLGGSLTASVPNQPALITSSLGSYSGQAVEFTGSDEMGGSFSSTSYSGLTSFAVVKWKNAGTYAGIYNGAFTSQNDDTGANNQFVPTYQNSSNPYLSVGNSNNISELPMIYSISGTPGQWDARYDAKSHNITATLNVSAATPSAVSMTIAVAPDGATQPNLTVFEYIVYNRKLSDGEYTQVMNYLKTKYNYASW